MNDTFKVGSIVKSKSGVPSEVLDIIQMGALLPASTIAPHAKNVCWCRWYDNEANEHVKSFNLDELVIVE